MGFLDDLGKTRKRFTLDMNKTRGAMSEQTAMAGRTMQGYEVQRTGYGSDWRERKVNILSGEKGSWTYVEHKSGGAQLSELQEKTKRNTSRYRVDRS